MGFESVVSDITALDGDVSVNAANRSLLGGGGVDGAIHPAAGEAFWDECRTLGGCAPGEAKVTKGYALPAGHVIHTVGSVWHGGDLGEPEVLAQCYSDCLRLAEELGVRSIAFPAISTGAYGFPHDLAADIAVAAVRSSDLRCLLVATDEGTQRNLRKAVKKAGLDV
ncbi:MAG: macro domain-containing protein [Sedimentitalea sp.]